MGSMTNHVHTVLKAQFRSYIGLATILFACVGGVYCGFYTLAFVWLSLLTICYYSNYLFFKRVCSCSFVEFTIQCDREFPFISVQMQKCKQDYIHPFMNSNQSEETILEFPEEETSKLNIVRNPKHSSLHHSKMVTHIRDLNSANASVWFRSNPILESQAVQCMESLKQILIKTPSIDMVSVLTNSFHHKFVFNARYGDLSSMPYDPQNPEILCGMACTDPPIPQGDEIEVQSSLYYSTTPCHGPRFITKRRFGKGAGVLHRFELSDKASETFVIRIPDRQVLRTPLKKLFEKYFGANAPLRKFRSLKLIQDLETRSFAEGQTLKGNAIRFFFDMFRFPGYSATGNTEILLPRMFIEEDGIDFEKHSIFSSREGRLIWKRKCGYTWKEGDPHTIFDLMQEAVKTHIYIRIEKSADDCFGGYRARRGELLNEIIEYLHREESMNIDFAGLMTKLNVPKEKWKSFSVQDLAAKQSVNTDFGEECLLQIV